MTGQQNFQPSGLSLKYKILILLVTISSLGLGAFLWLSVRNFAADKTNYLLENSTQLTLSQAEILDRELEKSLDFVRILSDQVNLQSLEFSELAQSLFAKQGSVLKLQMVRLAGVEVTAGGLLNKTSEPLPLAGLPFYKMQEVKRLYLVCHGSNPSEFYAVYRMSAQDYSYIVAEITAPHIRQMKDVATYGFALSCSLSDQPVISLGGGLPNLPWKDAVNDMGGKKFFTKQLKSGAQDYLLSVATLSVPDIQLLSYVDTGKAMSVIHRLQLQAFLFFVSLLALICIIAFFAANHLTGALEQLTLATRRLAGGDFSFDLTVKANDEVRTLTESFKWMRLKILELLEKTKQAARMEAELETATTVQRTLFPAKTTAAAEYEIYGEYRTASECGGDLWHHFDSGGKLFLFIGDVVGHGVPSALMTTAARSVTSIVRLQGEERPAEILKLLNHSIYETSKGQMWMTFFVGVFDKATGRLTYASASQNPPFYFPAKEEISKADVEPLMDSKGPSLGREESPVYAEATFDLEPGGLAFFYTDGLTECANPAKEQLGESRLIRSLTKVWNQNREASNFSRSVEKMMDDFRKEHPLEDDVTFFVLKRLSK